ncbi:MAG: hypothetical protein Q8P52_01950 [bacterium]|nr:hypothetical protein [bacterium]
MNCLTKIFIFFLTVSFLGAVEKIYAAEFGIGGTDGLEIIVNPEFPKGNEVVNFKAESYTVNLNEAEISWFVDGEFQTGGQGLVDFSVQIGPPGTETLVTAIVKHQSGASFTRQVFVRPAEVSLIWEANGFTPPFYKGKTLFSYEGEVRVIARPNIITKDGRLLSSKSLVYIWKENGQIINELSGYGKDVFVAIGTVPLRPITISVEAKTADEAYVAKGEISIAQDKPVVLFYEKHPLYGILYNRALRRNLNLNTSEMSVVAIPYFFTADSMENRSLLYSWNMNGIPLEGSRNSIVLRAEEGKSGRATVGLEVRSADKLFQFGEGGLNVYFGEQNRTRNIFLGR